MYAYYEFLSERSVGSDKTCVCFYNNSAGLFLSY